MGQRCKFSIRVVALNKLVTIVFFSNQPTNSNSKFLILLEIFAKIRIFGKITFCGGMGAGNSQLGWLALSCLLAATREHPWATPRPWRLHSNASSRTRTKNESSRWLSRQSFRSMYDGRWFSSMKFAPTKSEMMLPGVTFMECFKAFTGGVYLIAFLQYNFPSTLPQMSLIVLILNYNIRGNINTILTLTQERTK